MTERVERIATCLRDYLFTEAPPPLEGLLDVCEPSLTVTDGSRRLHGPAARAWLRGLPRPLAHIHDGVSAVSPKLRRVVLVGQGLTDEAVLTLVVTVREGRVRRIEAFRAARASEREDVYDTAAGAGMAALGWRRLEPGLDTARWEAVRVRVPALDPVPPRDGVWLRDGAAFVLTGWIGLVGLIIEESDGPIHEVGSLGQHPPHVAAWAWSVGLSIAATGAARAQTVTLAASDPGRLGPILAELRRWQPELDMTAVGRLDEVDLLPVWTLLYEGHVQGWLRLTLG